MQNVAYQSDIDPEESKLAELHQQGYRIAGYVGIREPHLLSTEYGIEGNPELALMKLWSRVSQSYR